MKRDWRVEKTKNDHGSMVDSEWEKKNESERTVRDWRENSMLAEQEDKVNEVSRGKTTDIKIKATYVKFYHQRTKMDWLRMVFSTSMGLECTLSRLGKNCTGEHMTFWRPSCKFGISKYYMHFWLQLLLTSSRSWIPVTVWNIWQPKPQDNSM